MPQALEVWPSLSYGQWRDTYANLHLRTQIVGKIRLAQTPWVNHSWHVTLYVTPRGLTTGPIPYEHRSFSIEFDFLEHRLLIEASDGHLRSLPLKAQSIADFYVAVLSTLRDIGIEVQIHSKPNEIADGVAFADDRKHRAYDPDAAQRFWRALVQIERVLLRFRSAFLGKVSPVHFFWGSFDLAVTRFSGRPAPTHPGGVPALPDTVAREAYSHEVSSAGFWPGGGLVDFPAFYSYTYPEPEGFRTSPVQPQQAYYHAALHEFILPYDAVRMSPTPDETLFAFLQSTYEAAANNGAWDRQALECLPGALGIPRSLS